MAPRTVQPAVLANGRSHRATYSRDKKNGGYIIRVEGPRAKDFAGRDVPVTRKDGTEDSEKLVALVWSGVDDETGKPVALYTFEPKPKDAADDEISF
jgi:hypothetical protein